MLGQKINITPLDNLFSAYIRTRDGWMCRRCKKEFDPATRSQWLDHAHIIPRSNWSVRLNEKNGMALCKGCHRWWHSNPVDATAWLLESIMTLQEYQSLRIRAKQSGFKRKSMDFGLIELELLQKIDDQLDKLDVHTHEKCPSRFIDDAMEYLLRAKHTYLDKKIPKEIKRALRKQNLRNKYHVG